MPVEELALPRARAQPPQWHSKLVLAGQKLLMPHDFPHELPRCVSPISDLPESSPDPSEQLSFAQEVTATLILRIWTQNDLCFKPIKFHVLPISTQANVLKIPILAQWWCLGASWPSKRRSLTQTAPEILQPNKRVSDGGSHLCYITLYPGIWTWPKGITMAQLRPHFTL